MQGPIASFREGKLSVAQWGTDSFVVKKAYKKEGEEKWTEFKITIFKKELIALQSIVNQMLQHIGEASEALPETPPEEPKPTDFDDDNIPF